MEILVPSNNPAGNGIENNPQLWPFVRLVPGEALDLNEIPEETNVVDPQTRFTFIPQGANNVLARLRAEFPYVPVMPFPPQVRTVALTQNVARDIEVPDFVQAVIFKGSGNYYVSNHGNAEIPVAANDFISKSIFKPEGFVFFTGGIRSFGLISPDVGCVVTLLGYAPQEMPRYGA